jgi:hypothetical protein
LAAAEVLKGLLGFKGSPGLVEGFWFGLVLRLGGLGAPSPGTACWGLGGRWGLAGQLLQLGFHGLGGAAQFGEGLPAVAALAHQLAQVVLGPAGQVLGARVPGPLDPLLPLVDLGHQG